MSDENGLLLDTADDQFLLFRLGGYTYASPLLSIHEIVLPKPFKYVPNSEPYYLGMINLRGQIIGVVDLRMRFELEPVKKRGNSLLVIEADFGKFAALVDEIQEVVTVSKEEIEVKPHIESPVPMAYITGVAKIGSELITVIDLHKIIEKQTLINLESSKLSETNI